MVNELVEFLLETFQRLGYAGIFFLMALESSFFPFPSEVVIPPAAYLAARGEMSLFGVVASGVAGSVAGAWVNYLIALKLGRPALIRMFRRYGRYFLAGEDVLLRVERFFERHGHISTFVGRLVPGVRQYISLPAGLGKMNAFFFTLFTALGAGLWVSFLAACGYLLGKNQELLSRTLKSGSAAFVLLALLCLALYWISHRKKSLGK